MNSMGISTDPNLLNVELPSTLIESPSVSTFLPEEEASICPLLSTTNGSSTPLTFSHPLTPCADIDSHDTSASNLCNEDGKVETSSSSGSSSGIGMDAPDMASTTLFSKHAYQHLQVNNGNIHNANGMNGNLTLSKDTPSFVSWNWPLIRKCTFFIFMSALLAMCAVVVAMIVTLPKTCNPKTAWFRGGVLYEIFPASFQDSDNDGLGDIRGIRNRVDYLASLGVTGVRLNSIFVSPHYPEDFEDVTSLTEVAEVLGGVNDVRLLAEALKKHNISLILDLPVHSFVKNSTKDVEKENILKMSTNENTLESVDTITPPMAHDASIDGERSIVEAMQKWINIGVNGFFIKGLEDHAHNDEILANVIEWKRVLGPHRVLILSEKFIDGVSGEQQTEILKHVDLVDVYLNVLNGTKCMEERIESVLRGPLAPTDQGVWIHWSIGNVGQQRVSQDVENKNFTLAAVLMQLMLPGTPSIFYGDEIALEPVTDTKNEHNETRHLHHLAIMQWSNGTQPFTSRESLPWLPKTNSYNGGNFEIVAKMVALRDRSPSIYKSAICKTDSPSMSNTEIRRSHDDVLIIERVYPRRNSFVAISNFGQNRITLDMTAMFYSGITMLSENRGSKVYFDDFTISPSETIVVKIDK